MKNTILLLFMTTLALNVVSQDTKLINTKKQWNVFGLLYNHNTEEYTHSDHRLKFAEDSVIFNGQKYYNILESLEENGKNFTATDIYYSEVGQKVYRYDQELDSSLLVFDFSLEVGDTFQESVYGIIYNVVKVDSILLEDGAYYKHIFFDCMVENWIEGYGSYVRGVIDFRDFCVYDYGLELVCAYLDDEIILNHRDSCWGSITQTKEFEIYNVEVSPNPISNQLNVSYKGNKNLIGSVIETNGRTTKRFELNNDTSVTYINMKELSSGMYILLLKDLNGKLIYSEKIIKL